MAFTGFPASAFEFYEGLEADNSKSYWEAHADVYASGVKAPMEALAAAVDPAFGSPLRMFRPYRDVRFSKDKAPYKTACAAVGEGEEGTAFYLQISATGLYVASGYYRMAPDQLGRFRDAVDGPAGAELEAAVAAVTTAGYAVGGDAVATAPRGWPRDHPRISLLRQKSLTVGRSFVPTRWVHGTGARARIERVWSDAMPVTTWLDRHVGPSELPPDDLF